MRFVVRRLLSTIPVMAGIIVITFLILQFIPGDPASLILRGTNATPERIAEVRAQLGLNKPLLDQFVAYCRDLIHGDLGYSYGTSVPVAEELIARLPSSTNLAAAGLVIGLGFGIPAGILSGLRPGSVADKAATAFVVLGIAVPYFWLGLMLIAFFAVDLGWFPAIGVSGIPALVLPGFALGIGYAAIIARLLRSSLIEIYKQPYILVARAKGLSETRILFTHALRNATSSIITMVGLQLGSLLAGAVAIEVIFGRPGIGFYLTQSIQGHNVPAIQAVVLLVATVYVFVNVTVDILQGFLDPRVRKAW